MKSRPTLPQTASMAGKSEGVKVYIRVRPSARFADDLLEISEDQTRIVVASKYDSKREPINNKVTEWSFRFKRVFHNASQAEVYETCASHLVTQALNGYNCTLFAYGQSGSGKTHTITGSTKEFRQRGIIPRTIAQLFQEIHAKDEDRIRVQVSYLEIYREQVFDLLSTLSENQAQDTAVTITEDTHGNAYAKGLRYHSVENEEEALNLLFEGEANRMRGYHPLNANATRSHCVFTLHIESHSITVDKAHYTVSKFNIVDLAGCERLGKTPTSGVADSESTSINKTLTFLEQYIISLADKKRDHIPYRQSKLTHILKDAFGGPSYTVMIGNIWGEAEQMEETLSVLRFGNRVRSVANKPAVRYFIDAYRRCNELENEVVALRKELDMYNTLTNRNNVHYEALSQAQIDSIRDQIQRFVEGELQEIDIINVRQVKEVFEQFKLMLKAASVPKETKPEELLPSKSSTEKREHTAKGKAVRVRSGVLVSEEEVNLVGETDGQGFGVGLAPATVKSPATAPNASVRKTKSRRAKAENSAEVKDSLHQSVHSGQQSEGKGTEHDRNSPPVHQNFGQQFAKEDTNYNTVLTKEEAFELFKKERGAELQRVLNQNKEILITKRQDAKELIIKINELKEKIDSTKQELEQTRIHTAREGERITTDKKPVIDEEEYILLRKEKKFKESYRKFYEELENTRSDMRYCEQLVDRCRKRLVHEFEAWHTDSFGTSYESTEGKPGEGKILNQWESETSPHHSAFEIENKCDEDLHEDEEEKLNRLQREILLTNPDSASFYNARLTTARRHVIRDSMERRPGSIKSQIRNKPPSTLIVS